ncbi:MAG: hypothetical protein V7635_1595, partial [Arthrobacter sp.]
MGSPGESTGVEAQREPGQTVWTQVPHANLVINVERS